VKRFWNLKKDENGYTLEILHEISQEESWWGDTTSSNAFRAELDACSGNLQVLINSPGGDVFAGADMYTALRQYARKKGHVTCIITGLAASAASMVAMAGDDVLISPVGTLMIHNPWTGLWGNADELREMADILDTVRDGMVYSYVRKTGKSNEEIVDLMAKETWMNSAQAIDEGFADAFFEDATDDEAAKGKQAAWRYSSASSLEKICASVKDGGAVRYAAQLRVAAEALAREMETELKNPKNDNRARDALRLRMMCL